MESECLTCKKHYSQGGDCWEHKRNCLYYDKEPRGKMMRTTFSFEMKSDAENTLIKQGEKLIIDNPGKEIEITIIQINWVDMENMVCKKIKTKGAGDLLASVKELFAPRRK